MAKTTKKKVPIKDSSNLGVRRSRSLGGMSTRKSIGETSSKKSSVKTPQSTNKILSKSKVQTAVIEATESPNLLSTPVSRARRTTQVSVVNITDTANAISASGSKAQLQKVNKGSPLENTTLKTSCMSKSNSNVAKDRSTMTQATRQKFKSNNASSQVSPAMSSKNSPLPDQSLTASARRRKLASVSMEEGKDSESDDEVQLNFSRSIQVKQEPESPSKISKKNDTVLSTKNSDFISQAPRTSSRLKVGKKVIVHCGNVNKSLTILPGEKKQKNLKDITTKSQLSEVSSADMTDGKDDKSGFNHRVKVEIDEITDNSKSRRLENRLKAKKRMSEASELYETVHRERKKRKEEHDSHVDPDMKVDVSFFEADSTEIPVEGRNKSNVYNDNVNIKLEVEDYLLNKPNDSVKTETVTCPKSEEENVTKVANMVDFKTKDLIEEIDPKVLAEVIRSQFVTDKDVGVPSRKNEPKEEYETESNSNEQKQTESNKVIVCKEICRELSVQIASEIKNVLSRKGEQDNIKISKNPSVTLEESKRNLDSERATGHSCLNEDNNSTQPRNESETDSESPLNKKVSPKSENCEELQLNEDNATCSESISSMDIEVIAQLNDKANSRVDFDKYPETGQTDLNEVEGNNLENLVSIIEVKAEIDEDCSPNLQTATDSDDVQLISSTAEEILPVTEIKVEPDEMITLSEKDDVPLSENGNEDPELNEDIKPDPEELEKELASKSSETDGSTLDSDVEIKQEIEDIESSDTSKIKVEVKEEEKEEFEVFAEWSADNVNDPMSDEQSTNDSSATESPADSVLYNLEQGPSFFKKIQKKPAVTKTIVLKQSASPVMTTVIRRVDSPNVHGSIIKPSKTLGSSKSNVKDSPPKVRIVTADQVNPASRKDLRTSSVRSLLHINSKTKKVIKISQTTGADGSTILTPVLNAEGVPQIQIQVAQGTNSVNLNKQSSPTSTKDQEHITVPFTGKRAKSKEDNKPYTFHMTVNKSVDEPRPIICSVAPAKTPEEELIENYKRTLLKIQDRYIDPEDGLDRVLYPVVAPKNVYHSTLTRPYLKPRDFKTNSKPNSAESSFNAVVTQLSSSDSNDSTSSTQADKVTSATDAILKSVANAASASASNAISTSATNALSATNTVSTSATIAVSVTNTVLTSATNAVSTSATNAVSTSAAKTFSTTAVKTVSNSVIRSALTAALTVIPNPVSSQKTIPVTSLVNSQTPASATVTNTKGIIVVSPASTTAVAKTGVDTSKILQQYSPEDMEYADQHPASKSGTDCPCPGCDGTGHVTGLYTHHRSISGCPRRSGLPVEMIEALVNNEQQLRCPTPGCNGRGHINNNRSTHRSLSGCPLAAMTRLMSQPAQLKAGKVMHVVVLPKGDDPTKAMIATCSEKELIRLAAKDFSPSGNTDRVLRPMILTKQLEPRDIKAGPQATPRGNLAKELEKYNRPELSFPPAQVKVEEKEADEEVPQEPPHVPDRPNILSRRPHIKHKPNLLSRSKSLSVSNRFTKGTDITRSSSPSSTASSVSSLLTESSRDGKEALDIGGSGSSESSCEDEEEDDEDNDNISSFSGGQLFSRSTSPSYTPKSPSSPSQFLEIIGSRLTSRQKSEATCPTPGCDGSGHVTGNYTSHRSLSGCPLADRATVQANQVEQKCPTPGCDGSGHVTGNYASHRSLSGCPQAAKLKKILMNEKEKRESEDPLRCPVPGCDGFGHVTGKYLSHRSASGCPIANKVRGYKPSLTLSEALDLDLSFGDCQADDTSLSGCQVSPNELSNLQLRAQAGEDLLEDLSLKQVDDEITNLNTVNAQLEGQILNLRGQVSNKEKSVLHLMSENEETRAAIQKSDEKLSTLQETLINILNPFLSQLPDSLKFQQLTVDNLLDIVEEIKTLYQEKLNPLTTVDVTSMSSVPYGTDDIDMMSTGR